MRLGIDMDGVCYPFSRIMRVFCEQHLHRQLAVPETWNFYEQWDLDESEFVELMRIGCQAEWVFHLGDPYDDCADVLERLGKRHEIVIVTHRPEYARPATEAWLKRWRIPYHELHHTVDKTAHRLDILLDDSPANLMQAAAAGIVPVVYSQPWNTTFRAPEVRGFNRVASGSSYAHTATAWHWFRMFVEEREKAA